ncbi:MAG: hypothetical protein GY822_07375 [Deltaproteobacteria bacterium]|nr:hypothetical protein [Deltaproteobacteria bacterium]
MHRPSLLPISVVMTAIAFSAGGLFSNEAFAQDPYAPPGSAPAPSAAPTPTPTPSSSSTDFGADVLSSYAVRAGQVGIGIGMNGTLNLIGQQVPSTGPTAETIGNYSLYGNLTLSGSFFPVDHVEAFGFAGGMARQLPRGSFEMDGMLGGGVGYHFPVTDRVTVIGSAGLGGYLGFSTYDNGTDSDPTSPFGVIGLGRVGMGYMLSRWLQVRVDLEGMGTGGAESFNNNFYFAGMFNAGARLGVYGYF